MLFWDKNLKAFEKKGVDLAVQLRDKEFVSELSGSEYIVEKAKDGSEILGIVKEGKKTLLNSTYFPKYEAEQFAKKITFTDNSITVFMGLGNGEMVKTILQKLNEEAILLIYEPSAELFRFVLAQFDLSAVIEDRRTVFLVDGMNGNLFGSVLSYLLTGMNVGVTTLETHPKYQKLYPEKYSEVKAEFDDCRTSKLLDLKLSLTRGQEMTKSVIANIPYFVRSKLLSDFVGKFPKDMPAILVAGGPSLEKNYALLKQVKGKALIIAMDRTAGFLLNQGIEPDVFCSVDYNKNPALFQDERLRKIPFVYVPDVSHQVMNILNGEQLIYATGRYPFYDWLIQQEGKEVPELPLGGSVSTLAFSFAWYVGIRQIIFVGQDLALTGGRNYAGGWQSGREDIEQYERRMVPGNVEEQVETRADYYTYLTWFNQAIEQLGDDVEVINATEGGAKINGTKIMTLKEAIDRYCTKKYDISSAFDAVEPLFAGERRKEVCSVLVKKGEEIAGLKRKAKEAAEMARRCRVLIERNDYGREFKEKNKKLSAVTQIFEENAVADLVSKYVENELAEQSMDLYITEEDEEKEMLRLYQKLERNYQSIYEHIDEMIVCYQTMLEKVKEECGTDE